VCEPPRDHPSGDPFLPATVVDEAGLVDSCETLESRASGEFVSNGQDVETWWDVHWGHGRCDRDATFTLRATEDGRYSLAGANQYSYCVLVPESHTIRLHLNRPTSAALVSFDYTVTPGPGEIGLLRDAWWELAPSERPHPGSRTLDLIVHEAECAGDPEGRVLEPEVEYSDESVSIAFAFIEPAQVVACAEPVGVPVRIDLAEPLARRNLVDAGLDEAVERVVERDRLLVLEVSQPLETAELRLYEFLGDEACPQFVQHDREIGEDGLREWATGVTDNAMTPNGLGWVGDAESAARAFGGFELYRDGNGRTAFIAFADNQPWLGIGDDGILGAEVPPGSLIVADLLPVGLGERRVMWTPAFAWHGAGTPLCETPTVPTVSTEVRAAGVFNDFLLSLSAAPATVPDGTPYDDNFELVLDYLGEGALDLSGSGSGLVIVLVDQLDGPPPLSFGITSDCRSYSHPDEPEELPFRPLGNAFQPGIWKITASADFTVGTGCGGPSVTGSVSIIIRIV
jgi:hypothetical protein